MEKDFKGINHGKGVINLPERRSVLQMRPTEIHLKEDGSLKDEPSFAILMDHPQMSAVGQISLEMFNDGLADIGYKIVKL